MSHMERGRQYLAAGNLEKARIEFRNALQIEPKDAEAPVINALRKEVDRRQIEFVKSGKLLPLAFSSRLYDFKREKWVFGKATDEIIAEFIERKVYWQFKLGGAARVWLADPAEAQYLETTTAHLLEVAGKTVNSVVYGILGTALAQGVLAGIGFLIAGVPGATLLGLATFFLSVVPVGPPLIWASATVWLYYQGAIGMAIFMGLWGLLVISLVDNFLRPIIISRGSHLPFILVFLGVLGGVLTFGFIGVFLGPTFLAVGYHVLSEWMRRAKAEGPQGP